MEKNQERLTVPEAARYLRVSKACLDVWRSHRKGPPYIKLGHRIFYRKGDLDAYLAANLIVPHTTTAL